MYSFLDKFFNYLSEQILVAILFFVVSIVVFDLLYKKLLLPFLNGRINFLDDPNKSVSFCMILFSAAYFVVAVIIMPKFKFPFIWILGAAVVFGGGVLGMIPTKIIKKRRDKEKR